MGSKVDPPNRIVVIAKTKRRLDAAGVELSSNLVVRKPKREIATQGVDSVGTSARRPAEINEPLGFIPERGMVVMCDFRDTPVGKFRRAVVMSDKQKNRRTIVVLPISGSPPGVPEVGVDLAVGKYDFLTKKSWVKCQTPTTREDRHLGKIRLRSGQTAVGHLDEEDLDRVNAGFMAAVAKHP